MIDRDKYIYIMKFSLSQWNKALEFENKIRLIINFYFK